MKSRKEFEEELYPTIKLFPQSIKCEEKIIAEILLDIRDLLIKFTENETSGKVSK